MRSVALAVIVAAAGCGGAKSPDPAPVSSGLTTQSAPGEEMVPPEKMDEITRNLERKRPIMAHCLALAVDNKELPRSAAGKVTVEIIISPNGHADSVKVTRASLESETLNKCVIQHIQEIQFPELPKPYPTSFTYGFEAM